MKIKVTEEVALQHTQRKFSVRLKNDTLKEYLESLELH